MKLALLLTVTATGPIWAAGVETQHALDVTLALKPGVEAILHSRIRTQPGRLGLYQVRAGPILTWNISTRVSLLSGYYYAQQERSADNDFIGGHRFFAGGEIKVADTRRISVDHRLVVERFLSDATEDFNRYRLRSRLSGKGSLAPYTSHEIFLDASGWRSNRHSAGVRWNLRPSVQVDVGYLFEFRRFNVGGNRHMWLTSIQWKTSSRRADPDR